MIFTALSIWVKKEPETNLQLGWQACHSLSLSGASRTGLLLGQDLPQHRFIHITVYVSKELFMLLGERLNIILNKAKVVFKTLFPRNCYVMEL